MPTSDSSPQDHPVRHNVLGTVGVLDPAAELTEIRLGDGRILQLPTSVLEGAALPHAAHTESSAHTQPIGHAEQSLLAETVIPLAEEQLHIDRKVVPTGTVRLHKSVHAFDMVLNEPLALRTYDIERIVLNQPVETAPGPRQEGETTIYPVVEEQAIVTKQLVLKEEIRVTKRDTERRDQRTVTLRREQIEIEKQRL